ncbi:MAG: hypothetical protein GY708_21245, partial [Actinomycetia bacterium]|nr:hypothetical protein [Actinomycetes bacterium]
DLTAQDYLDTDDWAEIKGDEGSVYRYIGTTQYTGNLADVDYEGDTTNWEKVTQSTADYIPNIGNLTGSDSIAIGGLIVRNDVRSDVDARIDNIDLAAGGNVKVDALSDAAIQATGLIEVSSSGGSAFGTGTSLAVNGTVASNNVLSSTVAKITDSQIGDTTTAIGGNVEVTADNTSGIDATLNSSTSTGDTAVGFVFAFNSIGWKSQNILFDTVDTLLGTPLINTAQPAEVIAAIVNSTVDTAGDLTVTADNEVGLNATVSNAASSAASALFGATGMAASGILASNKVNTDAQAYVRHTAFSGATSVDAAGSVTIAAKDEAGVFSNSKLVSSSITTNDGGASILQET